MKIHYTVLDARRTKLLPALRSLKGAFYLAGGTGLALQLGHRISVDFDFFTDQHFDSTKTRFLRDGTPRKGICEAVIASRAWRSRPVRIIV